VPAAFVSEPLEPVVASMSSAALAAGAPDAPRRFRWRNEEYEAADVLERWKESGPCRNGAAEVYLRKHWFRIRTTAGLVLRIYFERQPRAKGKQRWWVYSVEED